MSPSFLTQPLLVPSHFMPPFLESGRLRIAAARPGQVGPPRRPLAAETNAANTFNPPGGNKAGGGQYTGDMRLSTRKLLEWVRQIEYEDGLTRFVESLSKGSVEAYGERLKVNGDGSVIVVLLGDINSLSCKVETRFRRNLTPPDPMQPENVAKAIASRSVPYVLLTSVDRDDLPDGGSGHVCQTVKAIKKLKPEILVECVASDFQADLSSVSVLANSGLEVFAHNLQTVKRLQTLVRGTNTSYEQSLSILRHAKLCNDGMITRSSIMVGLGESDEEVKEALMDLRTVGVDILTLGQFHQKTQSGLTAKEFVAPEKFSFWKEYGESLGFLHVACGPWVRPSDHASEVLRQNAVRGKK